MVVFGDNSLRADWHRLLIITLILTLCFKTVNAQKHEFKKEHICGKWIMINFEQNPYELHDTIIFKKNKEFQTSIVPQTINIGKWNLVRNRIKLKSCLHSSDNPYKCRDFKWDWIVLELSKNRMKIKQLDNSDGKIIEYKKIE